jgi:glucose/arabinose dehydrogenase
MILFPRIFPPVAGLGALLLTVLSAAAQFVPGPHGPLALPARLPSTSGYQLEDAFAGALTFRQPVAIAAALGEKNRIFIVEKTGIIYAVTGLPGKPVKSVFLDIPAMLAAKKEGGLGTAGEWGVLGLAFHPRFAENGLFFVAYDLTVQDGRKSTGYNRLSRFSISKTNPDQADPASEQPLITQLDFAANHNGGDVHFGPDGYLCYSMGDGGGHYDPAGHACVIDRDFFAGICRLDVDLKPGSVAPNPHAQKSAPFPSAVHEGTYKIPADNPFLNATSHNGKPVDPLKVRTEIYACGMRNPWRFCFDAKDGRLFVGVVGEDAWEQVDLVKAGDNHGWSFLEGTHPGPRNREKPAGVTFAKPIYEYPHGNDTIFSGNSVTGGVVSRGARLPELEGAYIFGDYISHCVWSLREQGGKWVPELLARGGAVTAFGTDPANGDVLLADFDRGRIQRLTRAPKSETPPPPLLSQTGLFADTAALAPAAGILPYAINHEGWNGPVTARRWLSVPAGGKIGFNRTSNWNFPTGTVWVQHFDALAAPDRPARKLETRLLVKTETAAYAVSYRWRADQSDAELVPDEGIAATPGNGTAAGWHYPGRAQCIMCHTSIAGYALGMNTYQLNRPSPGDANTNQLQSLVAGGQLAAKDSDFDHAPSFAAVGDTTRSLEDRFRSYVAVNCSQCHQQDGVASSPWSARASLTMERARLINGPLNIDFGDRANKVIVPGDPAHSMLLRRLKGDGAPRMPMGSVADFDDAGIALVTEWINAGAPTAPGNPPAR